MYGFARICWHSVAGPPKPAAAWFFVSIRLNGFSIYGSACWPLSSIWGFQVHKQKLNGTLCDRQESLRKTTVASSKPSLSTALPQTCLIESCSRLCSDTMRRA